MNPYFSERDVEVPRLLQFVDAHPEIVTILDVGCFGSKYLYKLKERGKIIDGIDIKFGEEEKKFLRNYFVGNAVAYSLGRYDLVICLSTLEHAGISQYKVDDWRTEQLLLFKKVTECSRQFIYVTFPYGSSAFHEGVFANVTRIRLNEFLKTLPSNASKKLDFYFNEKPQAGQGWIKIRQDEADKIQYDRTKGVRCVCILEVSLKREDLL